MLVNKHSDAECPLERMPMNGKLVDTGDRLPCSRTVGHRLHRWCLRCWRRLATSRCPRLTPDRRHEQFERWSALVAAACERFSITSRFLCLPSNIVSSTLAGRCRARGIRAASRRLHRPHAAAEVLHTRRAIRLPGRPVGKLTALHSCYSRKHEAPSLHASTTHSLPPCISPCQTALHYPCYS